MMVTRLVLLLGLSLAATAHWQTSASAKDEDSYAKGLTGSGFLRLTENASIAEREEAFVRSVLAGQMPAFYQSWIPIHTSNRDHRITFFVKPNYLSIGNSDDYLIVPLNWYSTKTILTITDSIVPTTKMVDLIYEQSKTQLQPKFLEPGPDMMSNSYLAAHQSSIDAALFSYQLHELISGHKKDIVLSKRLQYHPDRIAIYGWHQNTSGVATPVQPLSLWHGARYADYSHGVRLVHRKALLDGYPVEIRSILSDPDLAPLLSDEGPLDVDLILEGESNKFGQAH